MPTFTRLAAQSDLPTNDKVKEFPCGEKMVCIANVDGTLSAMDNVCLHRGGPLGEGTIENGKVVCPLHGWRWDPKTGQADQDAKARIAIYPLKIENGELFVDLG